MASVSMAQDPIYDVARSDMTSIESAFHKLWEACCGDIVFLATTIGLAIIVRRAMRVVRDAPKLSPKSTFRLPSSNDATVNEEETRAHRPVGSVTTYMQQRATCKVGNDFSFLETLKAEEGESSTTAYYATLVKRAVRGHSTNVLDKILDDVEIAPGIEDPLRIFEVAMKGLAGKNFVRGALSIYERIKRAKVRPSATTLACLIQFAHQLGQMDRVVAIFDDFSVEDPPPLRVCMMILRVHGGRHDWNGAVGLLRKMKSKGTQADTLLLNQMLSMGVADGHLDSAEALLGEGIADVDAISYNTVLKGLAQQGSVERSMRLVTKMRGRGVPPNEITYNTAIDAASRAGHVDAVWKLYHDMTEELKLPADKFTCSSVVKSLQAHKTLTADQMVAIMALLDKVVPGVEVELGHRLCSTVLDACLRLSHVTYANICSKKMINFGFMVSTNHIRLLLRANATTGDTCACQEFWTVASTRTELDKPRLAAQKLLAGGESIDVATRHALAVEGRLKLAKAKEKKDSR